MPVYKVNGKKKDGLQKYQVKVNYTDKDGKHRQIMRTAYGAQAAKELERELLQAVMIEPEQFYTTVKTVQDLYDDYVAYISNEIRASSLYKKKQIFRDHILPVLGETSLQQLDTKQLQDWKQTIYQKVLSSVTMNNCYAEFRAALNYGVKMNYLKFNPLLKVGGFKDSYYSKPEMLFYTPEEFQKYKEALWHRAEKYNKYDYYVFFMIAYYTGARKGEIHALRWKKFDGKAIRIDKSINKKISNIDIETPPKNKSSIRTVPLPLPLIRILEEHRARQQSIIPDWNEDGFICGYYKPLRNSTLDVENRATAKEAGLKRIRVHDFRHSHASLLINNNINPLEVANRLGHSDIEQTLSTYSHLFPSEQDKSLKILNMI